MAYFVLLSLVVLIVLLARTSIRPLYLFGGLLALYYFAGLIELKQLLANFVNEGLVTLLLLLIISTVLERTIFVQKSSHKLFSAKRYRWSLLKMAGSASFFSSFLNNTAVVSIMMSMIKQQKGIAASRLLLPLSYAAIAGGTLTLIGTSTNLIVNSFVISEGLPPLEMFAFAPIGLAVVFGGIMYILLFSTTLLPKNADKQLDQKNNYFVEAKVMKTSPLIGKTVQENGLRNMQELFLAELIREDESLISPVAPTEVIREGDILVFAGEISQIEELQYFGGLQLFEDRCQILDKNLVEVIVSHDSTLVGQKIKAVNFRSKFNAAVAAVRRGSERLSGKIGLIELQAGDQLVLSVGSDFANRENLENNFYLITDVVKKDLLDMRSSMLAVLMFGVAIIGSALHFWPLFKAFLLLFLIFVALKWLNPVRVKKNVPYGLIVVIGSALGIASVIVSSGAAHIVVNGVMGIFSGYGAYGYLVAIYLLTLLLTEIITNNAAAALAFPIAYATAITNGVDPMPFIMAVVYGASASFMTPHGYQTNLMIYSVGRYRFKDYVRYGFGFSVIYSAIVLVLLPIIFPL